METPYEYEVENATWLLGGDLVELICPACDEVLTLKDTTQPIYGCIEHNEFAADPHLACSRCKRPYTVTNLLFCMACSNMVYIVGSVVTTTMGTETAVKVQGLDADANLLPCTETALRDRPGSLESAVRMVIDCMSDHGYAVGIDVNEGLPSTN